MASGHLGATFRQLGRIFGGGVASSWSEDQLLERFVQRRDEVAFEAIVARHGPMVLAVCRRLLDDPSDVDDAFQATFLVLVKKAATIRERGLLANWLYGVAHHVARRARAQAIRRRAREKGEIDVPEMSSDPGTPDDLGPLLHEEVRRLPERYRAPVVLCYLEGRTHEEAAEALGCPVGTVKGRLSRARDRLRKRLILRGLAPSTAAIVAVLSSEARAAVPPALFQSTVQAALRVAAGEALAAGAATATAAALTREALRTMFATQLRGYALGLLAVGLVGGGVGAYAFQGDGTGDRKPEADEPPATEAELKDLDAAEAAVALARAQSDLARAETAVLLNEYKQVRAQLVASLRAPVPIVGFSREEQVSKVFEQIGAVGETVPDRLAAAQAALATIEGTEAAAHRILKGDQPIPELEVDRARAAVLLAKLRAEHPDAEPAPWGEALGREAAPTIPSWLDRSEAASAGEPETDLDRKIREALDRVVPMQFADEPLGEVVRYITESTKGRDLPAGIPIYLDPNGLAEQEVTRERPVRIDLKSVPLRTSLQLVLNQVGLDSKVAGGVLVVSSPEALGPTADEVRNSAGGFRLMFRQFGGMGGVGQIRAHGGDLGGGFDGGVGGALEGGETPGGPLYKMEDRTDEDRRRTEAILARLETAVPMEFEGEATLADVVAHIKKALATEDNPEGLPVYIDPIGLMDAEQTEASAIEMDLNGPPLKTTLRLALEQLGLGYTVRQGVVIITSRDVLEGEGPERDLRRAAGSDPFWWSVLGSGMGGMGGGMGGPGGMGGGRMGGQGGGFR